MGSPTNKRNKSVGNYTYIYKVDFKNIQQVTRKQAPHKSSHMLEEVSQQTHKSTCAICSFDKKTTVGNVPKGHKYCCLFAFCGEGEGHL